MAKSSIIRVAVAQFETGKDRDPVLGDIVRFTDRAEAWETSIAIPGPMVNSISAKAEEHGLYGRLTLPVGAA